MPPQIALSQETIILADGQFPQHPIPLGLLRSGKSIVCCDGACMKLVAEGMEPSAVVGDLDSLTEAFKTRFSDRITYMPDQESNDLSKAVFFCLQHGAKKISILGATGLREDHTLGNISLLADYMQLIEVEMYTDTGVFTPLSKGGRLESSTGQQVSIFALTPHIPISLVNLKYPLENKCLSAWWMGSLNEALGDWFELVFENGIFIIFRLYP